MLIGEITMKKIVALILAFAMTAACVACTPKEGENDVTPPPSSSTQAGTVVDNLPTAGLNNTLEPIETFFVPEPTVMTEATPDANQAGTDNSKPFEKGAYASVFVKTPEKAAFSAPGYMGFTIANSVKDLEDYMEKFGSMFDFDSEFKEKIKKYDESFFTTKSVILIMHDEAEGAGSGRVKSVEQFDDYLAISLICDTNWASYSDPNSVKKAKWHCIIEMNTDDIVNNDVTVFEFE